MTTRRTDDAVEAAYDCWAKVYDSAPNATRDLDALVLRKQQLALANADVLEIGCGTGKNTEWLATEARTVLALDLSAGMLQKARERVHSERVRFVRHDLRDSWPATEASFDVVVADLVLEHVEHLKPFFEEAARVLRPGGRLFLCELHSFKQQLGSQARFVVPETGQERAVSAYRHGVSEYLNSGIGAKLKLVRADVWREETAEQGAPPRLLSLVWAR